MISPRERGRYSGYLGATFAVATVGGPLLGGVITDTDWLGWRWCFYVGVPFAIIALIVLQKTLKLPVVQARGQGRLGGRVLHQRRGLAAAGLGHLRRRQVRLDLLADRTRWSAARSCSALLFVLVESKASEPIIPLRLFRNRTITLASLASLFVGVAMFAGTVFFSQYFQLARDKSPTMSGVMTIPMIAGLFVSSTVSGQIITRTGRWKAWLVSGGVLVTAGLGLLGTIRYDTEYWHIAIFMALLGLGIGMMMQNLVLCHAEPGGARRTSARPAPSSPSSAPSAVRSASRRSARSWPTGSPHYVKDGLADLGPKGAGRCATAGTAAAASRTWTSCPAPLRTVMESAYGHGVGDVFLLRGALRAARLPDHPVHQGGRAEDQGRTGAGGREDAPGRGPRRTPRPPRTPRLRSTSRSPPGWAAPASDAETAPTARSGRPPSPAAGGVRLGRRPSARLRRHPRSAASCAATRARPCRSAAVTLISLAGRQLGRVGRAGRRLLRAGRAGRGFVRPDRLRRRLQPQASTVVVGDEPLAYDILLSGTSGLSGPVRAAERASRSTGAMVDRHRCARRGAGHRDDRRAGRVRLRRAGAGCRHRRGERRRATGRARCRSRSAARA